MKRTINSSIILFAFLALILAASFSVASDSTGKLSITITGFPNSDGFAMVALHNSEGSYKDEGATAIAKSRIMVVNQKAQAIFGNLEYGSYGISIFHDENGNGKMDKNAMGIPKEAYGFSNNARGFFGKPAFKDVMFELNSTEKQITINLD